MHSVKVFSAAVAIGAGLVSAASTCTKDIKISEPTPVIDCKVIDADVTVDESLQGTLVIEGPEEIKGDFIVNNVTQLVGLTSSTIESIGGKFELNGLTLLSTLDMQALRTLSSISLVNLQQLATLTFGSTGVTKAETIEISDTRISDLSGLNVATVENFYINNNPRLNKFNSDLVNITGELILGSNANNMMVNMTQLEMASEIQVSTVKSFGAPALATVEKSLKFDTNPSLTEFSADNLTKIGESLTFINNDKLQNISFKSLEKISGDMTIQNNTALEELSGFPELEGVAGAILLAGNFETVELPKLNDVLGTVTVTSTTDISDFCKFFDDASDDDKIQGKEKCTSNNKKALEGGDGGDESTGSSGSDDDDTDAAGIVNVNMAMLGLAAFAGLAQLF